MHSEFYFSNSNLAADKYLKKLVDQKEGWVAISKVASFTRIKALGADVKTIVAALRKSKEFLEVDVEGKNVKRCCPLPKDMNLNNTTIYAHGFSRRSTVEHVTEFFEQHLSPGHSICCVRLRKFKQGNNALGFKGSVFVEFSCEGEAKRIAELALKTCRGRGQPMSMMMKNTYIAKKEKESAAMSKKSRSMSMKRNSPKKRRRESLKKRHEEPKKKDQQTSPKRRRRSGGRNKKNMESPKKHQEETKKHPEVKTTTTRRSSQRKSKEFTTTNKTSPRRRRSSRQCKENGTSTQKSKENKKYIPKEKSNAIPTTPNKLINTHRSPRRSTLRSPRRSSQKSKANEKCTPKSIGKDNKSNTITTTPNRTRRGSRIFKENKTPNKISTRKNSKQSQENKSSTTKKNNVPRVISTRNSNVRSTRSHRN